LDAYGIAEGKVLAISVPGNRTGRSMQHERNMGSKESPDLANRGFKSMKKHLGIKVP
jgi:hypothetical protein